MKALATTKMSSKGQVVIPEEIRERLKLHAGDQFVVLGDDDYVILKIISQPSQKDFEHLLAKARKEARRVGLKKENIKAAIAKVRKKHEGHY